MHFNEFKALVSVFILPPTSLLLLALLGLWWSRRHRTAGLTLSAVSLVVTLLLGTNTVAVWLHGMLLPAQAPVQLAQLRGLQAIVMLGGGVIPNAPEYGEPQLSANTLSRLRYGVWLHRKTGLPLAMAGGVGWTSQGTLTVPEGTVTRRVAKDEYGVEVKWIEDESRDTAENAQRMAEILLPLGIRRIALVTEAFHMHRAAGHFRARGFEVVEAATDFPGARDRPLMEWMPSPGGWTSSRAVIREWIGLRAAPPIR
jgi:uncharacterized SAM-binding protein YcdF (DUF218 family)